MKSFQLLQVVKPKANTTFPTSNKSAHLSKSYAELSGIDYSPERKINERVIEQLATGGYIDKARNVVIVGACGTGKSYIANALASDACRKLHKTLYCRMFELISDIKSKPEFEELGLEVEVNPDNRLFPIKSIWKPPTKRK